MQTILRVNPWPSGRPGKKSRGTSTPSKTVTSSTPVLRRRPGQETVRVLARES